MEKVSLGHLRQVTRHLREKKIKNKNKKLKSKSKETEVGGGSLQTVCAASKTTEQKIDAARLICRALKEVIYVYFTV